jgi:integrase
MLSSGRRRGGEPGTGLGARLVTPPTYRSPERDTWSRTEVRKFLRAAEGDGLHAAWRLILYGLRRGEVLGLRWADVDLKAKTLAVVQARVLVDYKVRIEPPKSRNGKRTLPLDDELVPALTELRKRQARESEAAGTAYQAGLDDLDWYAPGDERVVTDELGVPVHPEWYSDEFGRLLKRARPRKIRLHDSRHTTLFLTSLQAGVPVHVAAARLGHADPSITLRV